MPRPDKTNVTDLDDVLMPEVHEQPDLPHDPLGVHEILERVGALLDGDLVARYMVHRRDHHSIRTVPNRLDQFVPCVQHKLGANLHGDQVHVRQQRLSPPSIARQLGTLTT